MLKTYNEYIEELNNFNPEMLVLYNKVSWMKYGKEYFIIKCIEKGYNIDLYDKINKCYEKLDTF